VVEQRRRVRRGQQGSTATKKLLHGKSRTLAVCPVQIFGRNLLTVIRIKPKPPKDAALAHPSQPSHTPERIVDTIEGAEFVDSSEILNASDSINDAGLAKNPQQSDDFISGEDPQVSNCSKQQPLQKFSLADTLEPLQDIHPISGANTTHHTETIYDPVPPDPSEFSDDPESANNFEESLDVEVCSRYQLNRQSTALT